MTSREDMARDIVTPATQTAAVGTSGLHVAALTEYEILKEAAEGGPWSRVTLVAASNANAAIRKAVDKLAADDQGGVFVAIPARSWKPVRVSAKVERTLVIEEATS